jgi:hypothetical protein
MYPVPASPGTEDMVLDYPRRITNLDVVNEVRDRDPLTSRLMDFTCLLANNVIRLRTREVRGRVRRGLGG